MRITFLVDQAKALRSGIDAPSSTVVLDVDPAQLPPLHREILADALRDGHIADQPVWYMARNCNAKKILLVRPTEEGLRDVLTDFAADRAAVIARERAAAEAREATRRAETLAKLGQTSVQTLSYGSHGITVERKVTIPVWIAESDAPEDLRPAVREQNAAQEAAKAAVMEELQAEHAVLQAETAAAREAERAAIQQEYDALYARLPELLRARHEAGYAPKEEIAREIRTLIRHDAGYRGHRGFQMSFVCSSLTDEQFAELLVAKQTAPAGAAFSVLDVFDREAISCGNHDETDGYDPECEDCSVVRENERRTVKIEWARAGVDVVAYLSLDGSREWAEPASSYAERMQASV